MKAARSAAVVRPTRGSHLEIPRVRPTTSPRVRTNEGPPADRVVNGRLGRQAVGCEIRLRSLSQRLALDGGKGSACRVKDEA